LQIESRKTYASVSAAAVHVARRVRDQHCRTKSPRAAEPAESAQVGPHDPGTAHAPPIDVIRPESRFQVLTPAEEWVVARVRVRERREGLRLCSGVATAAVTAALFVALASATSVHAAEALPVLLLIAAMACVLLGIVACSSIVWRLKLARLERRSPSGGLTASPPLGDRVNTLIQVSGAVGRPARAERRIRIVD
jgi:hypothetical protein